MILSKRTMTRLLLTFVVLSYVSDAQQMSLRSPITLNQLAIDVQGESREIAYTNKQAGHFYTETNGEHRTAWQGWTVMAREIMEDYLITLDNEDVRKSDAAIARVYPHQLQREYGKHRLRETLTVLDSLDAMIVELEHSKGALVGVQPLYTNGLSMKDYVVDTTYGIVMIARKNHLQRTPEENYPAWIGMTMIGKTDKLQFNQRGRILERNFSPCELALQSSENKTTIVFAAGNTKLQTKESVLYVTKNWSQCITQRRRRMESILNNAYIVTNDQRFTKALHWTILSMDGLIMNQLKKGIFAGLPWFNNYWGRDSFISLPGATMVLGHYSTAKDILQSFAEWQDTNPSSTNYGRIPNLVTTNSVHYNTADGTPWFTMSLVQYYKYSGDTSFAVKMYPVVKRAVEGTLQYHTDKFYFLTHGDAETWMDAVGPDGPWSPRGTRGNDIQALWWNQLNAAMEIAKLVGDDDSFRKWSDTAIILSQNFNQFFVSTASGFIYDHLNSDGTPDVQLRPNQLFAIDLVDDKICQQRIFENITHSLVYEHGIASLSQDDPNFHPYHHYQPYYVQDAAYHQGIVWTWLAGPWIHYATRFGVPDLAYRVTNKMVEQILDRGAVGTLSELLDAAPRSGETLPQLSGTFTQAWSLAEFIRNVYQSYLGVSIDATKSRIILSPNLPKDFLTIQCCVWIGSQKINIDYRKRRERLEVDLSSSPPSHDLQVVVVRPFEYGLPDTFVTVLPAKKSISLWIFETGV
ncbi:MAG TPA: amylo-alpha-1,6-glucosidase, partial [Bacteroidota bacterium]|nr:amylo-alpha-1,6-glucosidase [Bacteroidota bacterium]